jgi:hypothetical protein
LPWAPWGPWTFQEIFVSPVAHFFVDVTRNISPVLSE